MDPKATIDAVLEAGPHAFTIARWACLQRINSFLVNQKTGDKDLVPSLFVMFAPTEVLKASLDCLKEKAYEWADSLDLSKLPDMLQKALETVNKAMYMSQEPTNEKKTSQAMA